MKNLSIDINLDEEVEHLTTFINKKWTPIQNIQGLFTEIRDAALHQARGWFDRYELGDAATELQDERKAALMKSSQRPRIEPHYFDGLWTLLDSIDMQAADLAAAGQDLDGPWRFEQRVRALECQLMDRYPDLQSTQPIGWQNLKALSVEDAIEAYNPAGDRAEFEGVEVSGTLSPCFSTRVALPYVMYEKTSQDTAPSNVLVSAVFAHFLCIARFLNTERLKQDLRTALPGLQAPNIVFERQVTTNNPILNVLFQTAKPGPTPADFEDYLTQLAEYESLSEEEKARVEAQNMAEMDDFINQLCHQDSEAERQAELAEKQRCTALLQSALNQAKA